MAGGDRTGGGPVFLVGPERSCERVASPMKATVFKAASKKMLKMAFFRLLSTMVSRSFYCRIASIKTDIIIDTWAMIFPSRSELASKQIRRTGRAEAVTKEGLAATLLPAREPDQMGQRHSLRPVRPRSCPGALRNGSLCCIRGMHLTPEAPTYSMRAHGGLPAYAGGV